MIVVTGATGQLGGRVVSMLLERVGPDQVGVSVREPEKVTALAEAGVRVRRGDYDDPESLVEAFAGADRVLLVSAPRTGDAVVEAHRTAIEAARSAGVGRLFYTSHIGSDPLSPFAPNVGHAATEGLLRDSGRPFTVLRNGFYVATPERQVQEAAQSGALRLPADAPVSWTTHDDLAGGIATLLLDEGLDEDVVNLTAAEAVDMAQVAALAADLTGRPVERVVVSDETYRTGLTERGVPDGAVAMMYGLWAATRQRRFGIADPTLTELLGRPTTPLRQVLEQALATQDAV